MKKLLPLAATLLISLTACGYKGDLYLPKTDDKAKFGTVQTGLPLPTKEPITQPEH